MELTEVFALAKQALEEAKEAFAYAQDTREKLDDTVEKVDDLSERMDNLENRMDRLDGKMDTLLDSTSQIKAILSENTTVAKSAKRNAKGWGFLNIVISIVLKIGEFFFIV